MQQAATSAESLGLYISFPFCRSKCSFCNFASGVYPASDMDGYVARLLEELADARAQADQAGLVLPRHVDTIYLGGGTPSILSAAQLRSLFAAIGEQYAVAPDAEITLEAAPGMLADAVLEAAVACGVGRISFGVQTFVDQEARAVGRLHTAAQTLDDLRRSRRAGIAASVDLIAGLPGQTASSWRHSLAMLGEARPEHASVYMLEVDEDSRLGGEMLLGGTRYGAGLTPSEDAVADFYAEACSTLEGQGLAQYEISNFARPGHQSRHNLRYWQRRPYLGVGLDAHSMLRSEQGQAARFGTGDALRSYLAGPRVWDLGRRLSPAEELEEAWFLGLRVNAGVSLPALRAEFGHTAVEACAPVLVRLAEDRLVTLTGDLVALTPRGRMLSNEVFASFLDLAQSYPQAAESSARATAAR